MVVSLLKFNQIKDTDIKKRRKMKEKKKATHQGLVGFTLVLPELQGYVSLYFFIRLKLYIT